MPEIRSLVGRLLHKKKQQQQSPPARTPAVTPPDDEVARKLATARQQVQASLTQLATDIAALPYDALKTPLDRVATTLRAQMATLDTLADEAARSSRLMQVGEAGMRLAREVQKATQQGSQLQAADKTLVAALKALALQLGALSLLPVRQPLLLRLTALQQARTTALAATDVPGLQALLPLQAQAAQLKADATQAQADLNKAVGQVADWVDKPLTALKARLAKASVSVRNALKGDLTTAQALARQAQDTLAAGTLDQVEAAAGKVYWACDRITKRITALESLAVVQASHDQAEVALGTLKSHPQFATAFAAQAALLADVIRRAKLVLAQGESATATALSDIHDELKPAQRGAARSLAEYADYQTRRKTVLTSIESLKKHGQAAAVQAEIAQLEQGLREADQLGAQAQGGWHRAKVALAPLGPRQAQALALADKLAAAAAQLPVLAKKLEDSGVPKGEVAKVAQLAHKLLVEENCDADQAVVMAKSASQLTAEGLDEPDALLSARVKRKLLGDTAVDEALAHAICKNVRGRGTASIEDIQCVAEGMKRMSPQALKALNDAGIVTGICRGPVTDMIPELADVNPRGWGDRTWDEVPGCYMGSKKMVVVGTMDDGSGGRKVPPEGEGPIPHGTPDLLGHEAGHAYDVAGGGNKRLHPDFIAARAKDVVEAPPQGLTQGRDDYFMTQLESPTGLQSGTDGAYSETFAESFALHFSGKGGKWPNLMAFWKTNPWGV